MNKTILPLALALTALSTACSGGDHGHRPSIGTMADQTVIRNTVRTSLDLTINIGDVDDAILDVAVTSSDESIIGGLTQSCYVGPCTLSLPASLVAAASVTLQVVVSDPSGHSVETSFVVNVVPRLVGDVTDEGPGSLRQAIADAESGDVIAFDTGGVFGSPQTIGLLSQLVLDRDVTIEGPGKTELTLSGSNAVRVLRITNGAVVGISGLTIADGRAPLEVIEIAGMPQGVTAGGGVFADAGSRTTFSACTIRDNVADDTFTSFAGGGGLALFGGVIQLLDGSVVANNRAQDGGGIVTVGIVEETIVVVSDSTVSGNQARSFGGGMEIAGGTVIVRDSQITGNTIEGRGGAIHSDGAVILQDGAVVDGNTSLDLGGGIASDEYLELQSGAVVSNNATTNNGGGIWNQGTLEIHAGASVTGNSAASGGGVFNTISGTFVSSGSVTGNTPDNVVGP